MFNKLYDACKNYLLCKLINLFSSNYLIYFLCVTLNKNYEIRVLNYNIFIYTCFRKTKSNHIDVLTSRRIRLINKFPCKHQPVFLSVH